MQPPPFLSLIPADGDLRGTVMDGEACLPWPALLGQTHVDLEPLGPLPSLFLRAAASPGDSQALTSLTGLIALNE